MLPVILAAITLLGLNNSEAKLERVDPLSIGPKIQASNVFVLSRQGQILWSKNPLEKRSMASLTKLMTALVVLDQKPNWSKKVKISSEAAGKAPVKIKLKTGDEASLWNLWHGSLMASANDATYALVQGVGLSEEEAVRLMNKKVADFNLVNTNFVDVTGLSSENISNAEDLAVIFSEALSKKMIFEVLKKKNFTWKGADGKERVVKNTNKLIGSLPGLEGGKTGYIEESKYNLAISAKGSKGWGVIAVILGAPSESQRFVDMKNVLAWTFSHYIIKR